MQKHFLPKGFDVKVGDIFNNWTLFFIDPTIADPIPRSIKQNEIPEYYFYGLYRNIKKQKRSISIPGIIFYNQLFETCFSKIIIEFTEVLEKQVFYEV